MKHWNTKRDRVPVMLGGVIVVVVVVVWEGASIVNPFVRGCKWEEV